MLDVCVKCRINYKENHLPGVFLLLLPTDVFLSPLFLMFAFCWWCLSTECLYSSKDSSWVRTDFSCSTCSSFTQNAGMSKKMHINMHINMTIAWTNLNLTIPRNDGCTSIYSSDLHKAHFLTRASLTTHITFKQCIREPVSWPNQPLSAWHLRNRLVFSPHILAWGIACQTGTC